jgi:branched-chain amino acid transport system substrate-binding protein
MSRDLRLGLSLSLSGKYAAMGRQAEAAIRRFVADTNAGDGVVVDGSRYGLALECHDDQSRADRALAIYRELCCDRRCDLLFGPYSSGLTRAILPITRQAGMVLVNHGGADDGLHDRESRMVVSILTPASEYLVRFIDLLATLKFWRKRLAIAVAPTPFADAIAGGMEQTIAARRMWLRGVRLRLKFRGRFDPDRTTATLSRALRRNRINAFASVGSYAHDLAIMRIAIAPPHSIPVLACVAAGITHFRDDLGEDAEGIVGPSQWEPELDIQPEIGPSPIDFAHRMGDAASDYPAAQIYAAGLLTVAALRASGSLSQTSLRAAFADLRTTTFFGDFAIDRVTGRQIGHKMLLVQWHEGRKQIIVPEGSAKAGSLAFPNRKSWMLLPPDRSS